METPAYRIVEEHDLRFHNDFISVQKRSTYNSNEWVTEIAYPFPRKDGFNNQNSEADKKTALAKAREYIKFLNAGGPTLKVIETYG